MLASVLVNEVSSILNDAEIGNANVRWPVPELLNFMSEGIAAALQFKPSLFVSVVQLPLAPGSTQRLPDDYSRILDIHFNVNPDGSEGPNVLPGVYNLQQAFQKPGCRSGALIEVYSAYPGSERYFWVDPPISANLSYTPKVEALVMVAPQPITDVNQPIVFPGTNPQLYQGALVDWMLYRCYSKDQESQTSFERGQAHLRAFQQYLGVAMGAPMQLEKSSGRTTRPQTARAA